MSLFHNGVSFNATETTSNPAVHREQEAAQTLLGPRHSLGLGKEKARVAFLSKATLGLLFVPPGEFILPEFSSPKLVLCRFGDGP